MYFPSKKDFWLFLLFWGTIIVCTVPLFFDFDWIVLAIMLPIDIVLIWFWFTTGYLIEEDILIVKFGPIKKRIPIMEIRKIRKTKNPLSAPALSIDRIELLYGSQFGLALISPIDKHVFVSKLLEINPHMDVEEPLLSNRE